MLTFFNNNKLFTALFIAILTAFILNPIANYINKGEPLPSFWGSIEEGVHDRSSELLRMSSTMKTKEKLTVKRVHLLYHQTNFWLSILIVIAVILFIIQIPNDIPKRLIYYFLGVVLISILNFWILPPTYITVFVHTLLLYMFSYRLILQAKRQYLIIEENPKYTYNGVIAACSGVTVLIMLVTSFVLARTILYDLG